MLLETVSVKLSKFGKASYLMAPWVMACSAMVGYSARTREDDRQSVLVAAEYVAEEVAPWASRVDASGT